MPEEWKIDVAVLFADYQSGLSIQQIADKHHRSWSIVQRKLSAFPHWKLRRKRKAEKRHHWPESRIEEVVALYSRGFSIQSVARQVHGKAAIVREVLRNRGIPIRCQSEAQTGKHNGCWRGGRRLVGGYWYVYVPDHPNATKHGVVAEHRLVMEKKIGRLLLSTEVVHHIDGNRRNNTIENLELCSDNTTHLRDTLKGRVPKWSEAGKNRIREGVEKSAKRRRKTRHTKSDARQSQ